MISYIIVGKKAQVDTPANFWLAKSRDIRCFNQWGVSIINVLLYFN